MPTADDIPAVLTDRMAFLLQLALRRAQRMGEQALDDIGITGREYGILALLEGPGSRTQHVLGATLGLDRTTTMKLVGALHDRGLVRRDRDPSDRRVYLLALTARGDHVRARAADILRDCDERFTAALSEADRRRLRRMLHALAASGP